MRFLLEDLQTEMDRRMMLGGEKSNDDSEMNLLKVLIGNI